MRISDWSSDVCSSDLTLAACSPSDKPAASNEAATQAPATAAEPTLSPLDAAIPASWRHPANAARDSWRHPAQTLRFFGVTPEQTVLQTTPAGPRSPELLAPLPRPHGHATPSLTT